MAPAASESKAMFQKDERVLCFHGELLYDAKVLEVRRQDAKDKSSPHEYRVHYKGWKNTWDDWVPQDRLRKLTDENRELASILRRDLAASTTKVAPKSTGKGRRGQGSEMGSGRGSEERNSSAPAGSRGTKRGRDNDIEKEDAFYNRPSIEFPIPDHMKALLVDDWEFVTKSMLLVPLPSRRPVNWILQDYWNQEKLNRRLGSVELDILEEFVSGMRTYFNITLGKLLLYRFERNQLQELRKLWESGKYPAWEGLDVGDCYGAEHLARCVVNLPEVVAQTNLDAENAARLKTELTKFTAWLSRNSMSYFAAKYEKPSQEYVDNAR